MFTVPAEHLIGHDHDHGDDHDHDHAHDHDHDHNHDHEHDHDHDHAIQKRHAHEHSTAEEGSISSWLKLNEDRRILLRLSAVMLTIYIIYLIEFIAYYRKKQKVGMMACS
ncbi:hypothetical protein TELCIR_13034 [Teladorsagia circumcincta]|uniref:Uncharacterized protein n=1 Tax=Teladorsagia circumcincta TaxID=45464 RepID=A0A2G9U538_TELCI|nr:hypothetical protein TELCIR_13034 [Teladorsagia circumcincta]